jgi:hypothetical protein
MRLFLVVAVLSGIATAAYAYNCRTTCYEVGNQVVCNQSCW